MSTPASKPIVPHLTPRLVSLDQFRGYTVAGMFLVNYMSGSTAFPDILKHHHNFCSYSDTIMPQFLFAVGFAFRLTFGRRAQERGILSAYGRMIRRFLGLILVAMMVYGTGQIQEWSQLYNPAIPWWKSLWFNLHEPIKREWMQTLGHIAVTSLWILPVIRAGAFIRILWMLLSIAAHIYISYDASFASPWFHTLGEKGAFLWVNTPPNGVDGGPFGFLTWCIPAIMGTIACDAIVASADRPRLGRLACWSILLMGVAYILSCGTRLYDVPEATTQAWLAERATLKELAITNQQESDPEKRTAVANDIAQRTAQLNENKFPKDPVWPAKERWAGKNLMNMLAEPPLVGRPPNPERDQAIASIKDTDDANTRNAKKQFPEDWYYRQWNYWMMSQRGGTVSYPMFGAGFSILVYLLFYILGDKLRIQIPVFRTFGVNALAGYILAGWIGDSTKKFMPRDPPDWYAWANFGLFFFLLWLFLRYLEKNKIFIRM